MQNKQKILDVSINKITVLDNFREKLILESIRFEIDTGKVCTIIGKNGSGKSTLLKSLTKLLPEDKFVVSGKINFQDVDLLRIKEKQLNEMRRNKIRYVFQDSITSFDPLRKLEYYFRFCGSSDDELNGLLQYFELPQKSKIAKMHNYELSGGMAQRFAIAIALSVKPDLLILDEPTSAIDVGISNLLRLKLQQYVKEENKSVLMVTQNLDFAKSCSDKIARLENSTISNFFSEEDFKDNIVR